MSKVMKTMTDGLKSSDKMFTDLEEKKTKFEEENQDFQLKMMQMLQQGMGEVNNFYSPYSSGEATSTAFTWPVLQPSWSHVK